MEHTIISLAFLALSFIIVYLLFIIYYCIIDCLCHFKNNIQNKGEKMVTKDKRR